MNPPIPIAIDLDGVLVDWVAGYRKLVKERIGVTIPPPDSWAWDREILTEAQLKRIWGYLKASPRWWIGLDPLPGVKEFLRTLARRADAELYDVYFVTQRPRSIRMASEIWLMTHGYDHPQVIMAMDKSKVFEGIGVVAGVEDNADLAAEGQNVGVDMTIIDAPYNQAWKGKRVAGILDWWKWLEEQQW